MSEALLWPIPGSEQEFPVDTLPTEVVEAEIIPFPNRTGLFFNKVTEQELTDYIGQTAKNMGIGLDIGWSQNYGICFHFNSGKDIDDFDQLFSMFEEECAGVGWDTNNPCSSGLLCLEDFPEDEEIYLLSSEDEDFTPELRKSDNMTLYLAPHWASALRDSLNSPDSLMRDKLTRYEFADFLLRQQEAEWVPEDY